MHVFCSDSIYSGTNCDNPDRCVCVLSNISWATNEAITFACAASTSVRFWPPLLPTSPPPLDLFFAIFVLILLILPLLEGFGTSVDFAVPTKILLWAILQETRNFEAHQYNSLEDKIGPEKVRYFIPKEQISADCLPHCFCSFHQEVKAVLQKLKPQKKNFRMKTILDLIGENQR